MGRLEGHGSAVPLPLQPRQTSGHLLNSGAVIRRVREKFRLALGERLAVACKLKTIFEQPEVGQPVGWPRSIDMRNQDGKLVRMERRYKRGLKFLDAMRGT